VEVKNAIAAHQARAVTTLADCTSAAFSWSRERRTFAQGGNEVTFLNIVLQIFLPDVVETIYATAQLAHAAAVGWHSQPDVFPAPMHCGLRTTEYLNYSGYKNLGEHDDAGSLYTVIFSLSDPDSYEGGQFCIHERSPLRSSSSSTTGTGRTHTLKPDRYSAVVFLSQKWHGVKELRGDRRMFTNELWRSADPPWRILRPCRESMAHFTERYEAATISAAATTTSTTSTTTTTMRPGGLMNRNADADDTADTATTTTMTREALKKLWPQYDETVRWFDETNQEWTLDGHVSREFYRDVAGPYAAEQYRRRFSSASSSSPGGAAAAVGYSTTSTSTTIAPVVKEKPAGSGGGPPMTAAASSSSKLKQALAGSTTTTRAASTSSEL
jgi:2OG-Fe(II) oxygenase superfamily